MGVKAFRNMEDCAVAWAGQHQDEGRANHGRFYFTGPTLYSYGSHFRIGKFITNASGERAVLLNTNNYSSSTGHHKSIAWRAVRNQRQFHLPEQTWEELHKLRPYYLKVNEGLWQKASRARKYGPMYLERAAENMRIVDAYERFVKGDLT